MRGVVKISIVILIVLSAVNLKADKNWNFVRADKGGEEFLNFGCTDSNNCYLFTELFFNMIIYKSTDKGYTWEEKVSRRLLNDGLNIIENKQVRILDKNTFYIIYQKQGVIEITENGGNDFRKVSLQEYNSEGVFNVSNIKEYNKHISAIEFYNRKLVITEDNWNSHREVEFPDSIQSFNIINFIDSNSIMFVINSKYNNTSEKNVEHHYYKYDMKKDEFSLIGEGLFDKNGKLLYEKEFLPAFTDNFFVNDSVWYLSGRQFTDQALVYNSFVYKTTNGGKNWEIVMDTVHTPARGIKEIEFRTEKHGIATDGLKIYETKDGGNSWNQINWEDDASNIAWVGDTPLVYSFRKGLYRLETVTNVEELIREDKFRVYQSGDNIEVAINDATQKQYKIEIYNQTGLRIINNTLSSSYGFTFQPIEISELTSGVYFYAISSNKGVEYSGKFVIVR